MCLNADWAKTSWTLLALLTDTVLALLARFYFSQDTSVYEVLYNYQFTEFHFNQVVRFLLFPWFSMI